jgi:signal transduction histidine kinase/ligand-binding sensor domain-containing protein
MVRDGFFSGAPRTITQTTDGYIWIGTDSGLYRFDGAHFQPWSPPGGKKLASNVILGLLGARDGTLWIGMAGGLARFVDRKLFVYPDLHDDVGGLVEDRSGKIWFTRSEAGGALRTPICQALPTNVHCPDQSDGLTTKSCCSYKMGQGTEGYLWVQTEGPLLRWKPGHSATYLPNEWNRAKGIESALCVVGMPDGSVLVCVGRTGPFGGLQRLSRGRWEPVKVNGFDGSEVSATSAFRDHEGGIWLGTANEGIYHLQGNDFEKFSSEDRLSGNLVYEFYQDRENGIWVATSGGVDYFHSTDTTTFSSREGLGAPNVDAVAAGHDNTVWFESNALQHFKEGHVLRVRPDPGSPGFVALFEDSFGRLWCGIDNDLYRYDRGTFRRVRGKSGGSTGFIVGITEDSAHDVWAEVSGGSHALIRIHGLQVVEEHPEAVIPSARALAAGPNGVLWLGLRTGDLARFHDGHAEVFPSPGGAKSYVHQVLVNPDGTVFATTSAGLVGWKDGTSHLLSAKNGLPCDMVIGAAWDNQKSLWLYTGCGLAKIRKEDIDRWWRDDTSVVAPKVLDDFQSGQRPNFNPMAATSDGRLWIANHYTLQMVDPAHLTQNEIVPPVHIEKLIADRKPYDPNETLKFPPLMLDLEIDYAALSFVNPQRVRFRYKLEGRDTTWQEAGNRRQAFYTDLRPGSYRFRALASNDDGLWNEEGASVAFTIAPAWYQTTVFRILALLAVLLLLWLAHRERLQQASRSIRARFDARIAERTRLARDLHDTLLQTLQGSKLVADDALERRSDAEHTLRSLERLSEWIDRAICEGRAALNALHSSAFDNRELSKRLQSALDERDNGASEALLSVSGTPVEMDPLITDEICRVGYEAIRNTFTHSHATRIEVQLTYSEDFTLIVRDNGRGLDSTTVARGRPGHFGLRSMRERASRIHGQFQLISAPNLGTTIELKIPGRTAFGRDTSVWSKLRSWLGGTRRPEA